MKIAVLRERRAYERRVAATPDTVRKLIAMGHTVSVETLAGLAAAAPDELYSEAGATIAATPADALAGADIVIKVQRPLGEGEGVDETALIPSGALLIGMLNPYGARTELDTYAKRNITALAMEFVPRITRAQSMDALSSQSNLAGYRAVLDAAAEYGRAIPMMVTAAGTVAPARVMVMGAGVAGLQAIATARRLGAIVSATDVRAAAREQVQSLGASFVMVESDETKQAETSGGYAKEMSEDYKRRQAALIAETLKKQDIVICTALIPGRAAPRLITEEMLATMRPGSIIVDLAVEQGGNCAGSEAGKIVETANGVRIIGHRNVPSRIPVDASSLYARNILSFLALITAKEGGAISLDVKDEIIKAMLLTHNGEVVHAGLQT